MLSCLLELCHDILLTCSWCQVSISECVVCVFQCAVFLVFLVYYLCVESSFA